jgi:hypothetical protein
MEYRRKAYRDMGKTKFQEMVALLLPVVLMPPAGAFFRKQSAF